MSKSFKYDKGKVRMGLCLTQFANILLGVAKVLTYGAMKYPDPTTGDRSWKTVDNSVERYTDAFDRHMLTVRTLMERRQTGGTIGDLMFDDESGQLHIDHAITNLFFLRTLLFGTDIDLNITPPPEPPDDTKTARA